MSTPGWSRRGAGVLLAALICAVLAGSGFDSSASAQTVVDYDADDDGLIEVASEAQLNAAQACERALRVSQFAHLPKHEDTTMRRANRLAIKPLVLLGTILFAAALLGGQPVQGQDPPTAAELDRAALEALYDSTDGANWTNSTNWKIDDDLGTWYGVLVNSDGRVTDLNLANNNLVGTLPDELGNLTSLRALTLNKNQLTGEIPT